MPRSPKFPQNTHGFIEMTTLLNAECRTQNEDTRKERYMEMEFTEYERTILDYANTAAGRLLILTQSDNEETAIRSCVEVLKLANQIEEMKRVKQEAEAAKAAQVSPLPPELASKWLAELANYRDSSASGV
jgi:hypothetical protein